MPTAENARLDYEAGQSAAGITQLTDSGDATTFTSAASLWSLRSGFAPVVTPDGLVTGGAVTPGTGNDAVDVAALTCYLAGVLTNVSAAPGEAVTRGLTTDVCIINSITVTSAGAIAVVAGTDNPTFSEVRGDPGGPPFIPVDSIEIAQVRLDAIAAAPVVATEIFQVVGTHQERYDFPLWKDPALTAQSGSLEFFSALPLIHTGSVPKQVFVDYSSPIFAELSLASDFVPPENSHTVNSTQIYGTTLASKSTSLGQGSFTAYLSDGVTDPLVTLKDEELWFRFYPDKFKTPYILSQGKLGIARTFPADDNMQADCTISASTSAIEKTT